MVLYGVCERCGHLVLEEYRFCPNCGARLEGMNFGESYRRDYFIAAVFVGILLDIVVVVFFLISAASFIN